VVGDRIPQHVEIVNLAAPIRIAHVELIDGIPEPQSKPVEVGTEVARIWVARVKFAILVENLPNCLLETYRRDPLYQEADAFVVEFTTEPLELRGQQEDVGVVELLGPAAPAAGHPADPAVGMLDLVERPGSFIQPALECL
jgi:hypothetical protein